MLVVEGSPPFRDNGDKPVCVWAGETLNLPSRMCQDDGKGNQGQEMRTPGVQLFKAVWVSQDLPEFLHFKNFGKTIFVVNTKFGLLWVSVSSKRIPLLG